MATKSTIKKKLDEQVTNTVQALNVNKVVSEIGELQVNIQSTLSGIAAQITGKLEELGNSEKAISIMQGKLAELYQVEKELQSIEEIKAKKIEEEEKFKKMIALKDEEFQNEMEQREKQWNREEEEHNYANEMKLKKFQNTFADTVEEQKRVEKARIDALTTDWTRRESELSSKEKELVNLKDQVNGFTKQLDSEIAKVKATTEARLKNEYEHSLALLNKDMVSERNLSLEKINALHSQMNQMTAQIKTLNEQLESARADSKEITTSALQSAAGRQVVDALQKNMENNSTTKKN